MKKLLNRVPNQTLQMPMQHWWRNVDIHHFLGNSRTAHRLGNSSPGVVRVLEVPMPTNLAWKLFCYLRQFWGLLWQNLGCQGFWSVYPTTCLMPPYQCKNGNLRKPFPVRENQGKWVFWPRKGQNKQQIPSGVVRTTGPFCCEEISFASPNS